MKYAFLCLFLLSSLHVVCQSADSKARARTSYNLRDQELVGCWSLVSENSIFVMQKSASIGENNSGICFESKGELLKRVATTWEGEVIQINDYLGRWGISSSETLTLTYFFDDEQTVEELVKIVHFDPTQIEWRRLDWKEVRR